MRREIDKDCKDCGGTGLVVASVEPTPFGPRLVMGGCRCVRWIFDARDLQAMIELGEEG
jgi:hypothetical protein